MLIVKLSNDIRLHGRILARVNRLNASHSWTFESAPVQQADSVVHWVTAGHVSMSSPRKYHPAAQDSSVLTSFKYEIRLKFAG